MDESFDICRSCGEPLFPNEKENFFVVFFDILGFREMMNLYQPKLKEYLKTIKETCEGYEEIEDYIVFSDNVVIYMPATFNNLSKVIRLCSQLLYKLIHLQIPIRGTISYGQIERDEKGEKRIVSGKPIIDAYDYERKQDWLGIIISPTLHTEEKYYSYLKFNSGGRISDERKEKIDSSVSDVGCYYCWYAVPYNDENDSLNAFAIIPHSDPKIPCDIDITRTGAKIIAEIESLKEDLEYLKACSGKDQKKYTNTLKFLRGTSIHDGGASTYAIGRAGGFLSQVKKERKNKNQKSK